MSGERWHKVVDNAAAITEDMPVSVEVGEVPIGVFRIGGELHAIEAVCPHAFARLSEGYVEGEEVECPLHAALFHVPTGECRRGPADRGIETYKVKVEDGSVYVLV